MLNQGCKGLSPRRSNDPTDVNLDSCYLSDTPVVFLCRSSIDRFYEAYQQITSGDASAKYSSHG